MIFQKNKISFHTIFILITGTVITWHASCHPPDEPPDHVHLPLGSSHVQGVDPLLEKHLESQVIEDEGDLHSANFAVMMIGNIEDKGDLRTL